MPELQRVILSSDFSPRFLNFLPIVSHFWKTRFGITPDVAVVYGKANFSEVQQVKKMFSGIANIHLIEGVREAPLGNQAKIARLFLAASLESEFSTIDDIDTVHVQSDFLLQRFSLAEPSKLLAIGQEVYNGTPHEGAFPMGNLSGPSYVFSNLVDIKNIHTFGEFVQRFRNANVISPRENPFSSRKNFSDEYLLRGIRKLLNFDENIVFVRRDLDIKARWLDRSWWPDSAQIHRQKYEYEQINFPRPFWENRSRITFALEAIEPSWIASGFPLPMTMIEWHTRQLALRFRQKRTKGVS